jgi:hypothetical protein
MKASKLIILAQTPAKEKQSPKMAQQSKQQSASKPWRVNNMLLGFLSQPQNFLQLYPHDCNMPTGFCEIKSKKVANTTAIATHSIVFGIDTNIPIFFSVMPFNCLKMK